MKQHLIDTFKFNDVINKKLLEKIAELPDKTESIKLFSHLINCQYKWMARVNNDPKHHELSWWEPLYNIGELESQWDKSLQPWLHYIQSKADEELATEVQFIGLDGNTYAAAPQDIALQLNYHSIHHRAQIQSFIRKQGVEADFVDYIGTKYKKLS